MIVGSQRNNHTTTESESEGGSRDIVWGFSGGPVSHGHSGRK